MKQVPVLGTWFGGLVESKASSENILPGMVGEPWWAQVVVYQIDPMWYHVALVLNHTSSAGLFGAKTISESIVDEDRSWAQKLKIFCG